MKPARETAGEQPERVNSGLTALSQCQTGRRRPSLGLAWCAVALLWMALSPGQALGTFIYDWLTTSGPRLSATFLARDTVVATGLIRASDIVAPPGFLRTALSVGVFTNLTADSALAVDPASGTVLASTHSLTATNATDTLLLSTSRYLIPTRPTQPYGRGIWRVTHLPDVPSLSVVDWDNGQAQVQVTCGVDGSFILQASTNLTQWVPILTNTVVNGFCTVTDPRPAVDRARSYRAVIGL